MTAKLEEKLKENDLKVTKARLEILRFLENKNRPFTINDLKRIKALKEVNESSLYRNLAKFEETGIIHQIPSAGEFQIYEKSEGVDHHPHITCVSCQTVSCLSSIEIDKKLKELAQTAGFKLQGHSLELTGVCKKCRAS